jgi:oxygen-dependent protoporphyrinogen oxidase
MEVNRKVLIVGAGITGLTVAYELKKQNLDVEIVESLPFAGGKIGTIHKHGVELDLGPISCSLNPAFETLLSELNLTGNIIHANAQLSKRYIYSEGKIHRVEPSIPKLLNSRLLSWRGKLAVLRDFSAKRVDKPDESVRDFGIRHFGEEVVDKLFDPVLNGIYAGRCDELSIRSVLPLLYRLEKEQGSIIKGLKREQSKLSLKRQIISFAGGFKTLIDALTTKLESNIRLSTRCQSVHRVDDAYHVELKNNGQVTQHRYTDVFITTSAYETGSLIKNLDYSLSEQLRAVRYAPVQQVYCSVKGRVSFDGFGFLIPSKEKRSLLGAIAVSNVFPQKYIGQSLYVLFVSGLRAYPLATDVDTAVNEFESIVQTTAEVLHVQDWNRAIPQPNVNHYQLLEAIDAFEMNVRGIHILGNYKTGVAVGDCVKSSIEAARKYSHQN